MTAPKVLGYVYAVDQKLIYHALIQLLKKVDFEISVAAIVVNGNIIG